MSECIPVSWYQSHFRTGKFRAKDNKDLHLVTPKKTASSAPQPSIAELLLPEHVNQFLGLMRDVKNDPMAVAKTGLAKLADYTGEKARVLLIGIGHCFTHVNMYSNTTQRLC